MKYLLYAALLVLISLSACKKDAAPDIIYQNTLETNNQTWPVDTNAVASRGFYQGHYSITVDSPDIISYALAPYSNINFPYSVQVDGTPAAIYQGNAGAAFAIVFDHVDQNDYAVAEIWTNGTYRIWTRTNGVISPVVNFTVSSVINPGNGGINTMKVIQNQSNMQLVINGNSMGTFNIALPTSLVQCGPATCTSGAPYFSPVNGLFNNFSIVKN